MDVVNINKYVSAIDNKDINEINKLNKNINKNNKYDVIFEIYNHCLLNYERLQFILKNKSTYFYISSKLIKKLIEDENVPLLDIIFDNRIRFYDQEFIFNLLSHYKNKKAISTEDLEQQLSLDKYKISIDNIFYRNISGIDKYLFIECDKEINNISKVKYLVELGADINKEDEDGTTPLFYACDNGNEDLVKYLVEHGADINKENKNGKTPLFNVCEEENECLVKYLVEHGVDINKEDEDGKTPLFYACDNGNEGLVKYLVEHGADINKENKDGQTPLFYACNENESLV